MGQHHLALLAEQKLVTVGDYDALLFEGTWHTSGELMMRARRVAAGLIDLGLTPGDRVVVLMMNTPEVGITYNAVWRAGGVVTPVLFLISPAELRHVLVDSGAFAVVVTPELLPLLASASIDLDLRVLVVGGAEGFTSYAELETVGEADVVAREDSDLAALLYTGGTTGRSKGVMLTHHGLWSSGAGLHQAAGDTGTSRGLLPLPLSHAYGLIVTLGALHTTVPTIAVLQRWFEANEWVQLVEEHRLETSPVVPSMIAMLLALPLEDHDLSCLKHFGSGGAPLAPSLREELARRLPGVEVFEGYGLTESSAVVSASRPGFNRHGSVGQPLPHVEVAILDDDGKTLAEDEDGEVCVRGAGVMAGYWKAPEATAETVIDGWLHTGDIGHLDADGFLYIVDRKKDLILRGGFNVFPRDVEEALMQHEDITAAAVVGRPDDRVGEEVVAFVSLRPGSSLTAEQIVAFGREHLSKAKYPREVRIVDAVPLTSVGKTDRKAARTLLA